MLSERTELHTILAFLSAIGLTELFILCLPKLCEMSKTQLAMINEHISQQDVKIINATLIQHLFL